MKNIRTSIFVFTSVLFFSVLSLSAFGQEPDPDAADPSWGLKQKLEERQKYWDSWVYSGPDSNIPAARERGLKQFLSIGRPKQFIQDVIPAWEQVGGSQDNNVSGRPTGIAFDPTNFKIFYLGTSGGGLWKTTDGGATWTNLSEKWSSYAMGDVAVDYTDPNIIYAATGDLYDRAGDGIYKSTDGGLNWDHVATGGLVGTQSNQILIDPADHLTLYHVSTASVNKTTDGGVTWNALATAPTGNTPHLVIDPSNSAHLILGASGRIVVSTDGGATWSGDKASNISGKSRITLGISKADPTKVYASISNGSGYSMGVARSLDGGETWELSVQEDYMSNQGWYDNACAVNQQNANIVVVGGLDVWNSVNGASTLSKKSKWTDGSSSTSFCHADIHVLEYGPTGDLYALTDGGVFISKNNGTTWTHSLNSKLSTMLFVGADADPKFSFVVGGCQDNGINRSVSGQTYFHQTLGGDGGRCFISQSDPNTVYSTYINTNFQKSNTGGAGWLPGVDGTGNSSVIPIESSLRTEGAPFYMYYDVCESDGSYLALCGNSRLYYSTDAMNSLDPISKSSQFSGGLRTVHITGADPGVLYVGGGGGYPYSTTDAGTTWVKSSTKTGVVSGFCSDPNDPGHAFAAISGYGNKHFYYTTDTGKTWTAPAKNLPDINAYTIARAPNGDLFIGHEFGVMRSIDGGVTWEPLPDGIPLCDVRKLQVRGDVTKYLLAATYGRGLYRIDIQHLPRTVSAVKSETPVVSSVKIDHLSPNPLTQGNSVSINYSLAGSGRVMVTLYDETGKEIRVLANSYLDAGTYDLTVNTADLAAGSYFIVLAANGQAATQRFVVTR